MSRATTTAATTADRAGTIQQLRAETDRVLQNGPESRDSGPKCEARDRDESAAAFWRAACDGLPGRTAGDDARAAAKLNELQGAADLLADLKKGSAVEMYLDGFGLGYTLALLGMDRAEAMRCLRLWMGFLAGKLDRAGNRITAECVLGIRDPRTARLAPAFGGDA